MDLETFLEKIKKDDFEKKLKPKRFPIYVGVPVLMAILTLVVICVVVQIGGNQMHGFFKLKHEINAPNASGEVGRDISGMGALFFGALWFFAPATASYLAIKSSTFLLDFHNRRGKIIYRIFTLVLILIPVWLLTPWIAGFSTLDPEVALSRVEFFRTFYVSVNLLVVIILTFISVRKSENKSVQ
jgi:hypothetical protein